MGTAYGFFRDDALNAPNALSGTKLPMSQQQYGASVGGPIRRMVAKRATLEKALKDFVARRAAPGRSARSRAD